MSAKPFRILAVCGSLQADSSHLRFLQRLRDLKVTGLEIHLSDHLRHLPLFNPDLMPGEPENSNKLEAVASWRQALADCHGIIIASPEYGHSLSGVLKNAIDWVIGSGELYRKTVAITTVVKHPERGLRGLAALKQVLLAVDAKVVWDSPVVMNEASDDTMQKVLLALREGLQEGVGNNKGSVA